MLKMAAVVDYFRKGKRSSANAAASPEPTVDQDFEEWLQHITSEPEGTPPPLPNRPQDLEVAGEDRPADAQMVIFDEAQAVPLPEGNGTPLPETADRGLNMAEEESSTPTTSTDDKKSRWSFLRPGSKAGRRKSSEQPPTSDEAAGPSQETTKPSAGADEAQKEEDEIETVMERLSMAAANSRTFSVSKESQELLTKFSLVFKDLVNGVPTAYHDLESLLTNSEDQLQRMYGSLPSFLQQLVEKLPSKFTGSLAPEVLAAAAEKHKLNTAQASKSFSKVRVPTLKELVTKRGALIGMLRAIMGFLRTRFPAVLGVNVLWSLALFVLMLVCWYCHKRGKEVRMEKERQLTEAEMAAIKAQVEADGPGEYHGPTSTTAPEGAPLEEVRGGLLPPEVDPDTGHAAYAEEGSLAKAIREEQSQQPAQQKP